MALSGASATGTLSSLDWNTFNNKQSALGYTPLNPANNLSDLANTGTARTNLGLGSLATQSGTFSGTSSGTNTGDQDISVFLVKTNNLSDITNAGTARTNLGLGSLATLSTINNSNWSGTGLANSNLANSSISFSTGTTGSDFNISGSPASLGGTLTLNIPSASALNRGLLTALDWSTFNSKQSALGFTPLNPASNLSDVANTSTARTNLGLGTLATQSGTFSGTSSGTNTGDQTTISGNAGTATSLQTARTINGVSFDGTANITVTSAAGNLTGTTLAGGVTGSSLTSVGTLGSLVLGGTVTGATSYNGLVITPNTGAITTGIWNGTTIAVANGGTGSTNGSITGTGALSFNSNTTNALTLDSGTTGAINIGTNANAKTITIGNGTGATSLVLNAGTGNIDIGANAIARTINVGTGAAVVETINIGGTGANVIGIGNTQTGGSVNIGAGMTTGTISIGGTGAQTGTITIDGGTGTQTINLATGAGVKTVNVGSTNGASTLTLESGTGALNIGTGAFAKTITIGNSTGTTRVNVTAGTGGVFLTGAGAVASGHLVVCIDNATKQLFVGSSATTCNTSSAVYKHDIVDIGLGLDAVNALRPVSFTYNSNGEKSLGFIAEEVALVDERPVMRDENGIIQGIDPAQITPILTHAIQQISVLIGDISPKVNADGSDNGLSTLVATIQSETAHDPIAIIAKKITDGKQFLTDFVAARVTAIRGYFDEIFANKTHQKILCVGETDDETCITKNQLDNLLSGQNAAPATSNNSAPANNPEPTSSSTPPVVVEPTPQSPSDATTSIATETPTDISPTSPDLPAGEAGVTAPVVVEPTPVPVEPAVTPEPTPPVVEQP